MAWHFGPFYSLTRCECNVTTIERRAGNNYFATHTTNVNSSFSSCPVISQQPDVGKVQLVLLIYRQP
jgi:hypothetical protein